MLLQGSKAFSLMVQVLHKSRKLWTLARKQELLMAAKHPGFKAVQSSIAKKQGVSKKVAGAILASSSRKASAKAKRLNPNLKKVKGK